MKRMATKPVHWVCLGDSSCLPRLSESVQLVACSPPFFNPDSRRQRMRANTSDAQVYLRRFRSVMEAATASLSEDGIVCLIKTDVWAHGKLLQLGRQLLDDMERLRFQLFQELIWVRRSYYSPYGPSYSHVFILCRRKHPSRRAPQDVLQYRNQAASSTVSAELFRFLIDEFSSANDLVLNPYLGSGSFIEAACAAGRRSIGIEIDRVAYRRAKEKLLRGTNRDEIAFAKLEHLLGRGRLACRA